MCRYIGYCFNRNYTRQFQSKRQSIRNRGYRKIHRQRNIGYTKRKGLLTYRIFALECRKGLFSGYTF